MLAHELQKFVAISRIGLGQHCSIMPQPFGRKGAVQTTALFVPARWVGTAKAKQNIARRIQRDIAGTHLQVQLHHVQIVKEVQVGVDHFQLDGRMAFTQNHPQLGDVLAAKYVHGRIHGRVCARAAAAATFAIQKALHIGQKGYKLAVVPLTKLPGIIRELVVDALPGVRACSALQFFPVPHFAHVRRHGFDLQWPDQAGME